jgi:hypothetical protein
VKSERGLTRIKHGAAVIAIGAEVYAPAEYLYGEDDRVMTQLELEEKIAGGEAGVINSESLVMIQCVGCRQEDRNYCARICCSHSIKNALKLKEINPEMDIYVLFRDMRTYGFKEDFYREASSKDVKFIRYEPQDKPRVEVVHILTRPGSDWRGETGRLDREKLRRLAGDRLSTSTFFLCCPPAMIQGLVAILEGLGVPVGRISYEYFSL